MTEKIKQGDKVPFTQVSNKLLNDQGLPLKAKGLLAYMLSKPDDWQFNVKSMAGELKEDKDTVARILNTLIAAQYINRKEIPRSGGKVAGYDYYVYQSPYPQNGDVVNEPESSPYPHYPDTVNGDIPNKEVLTNKEGGSSYVVPSTDESPPEPSPPVENKKPKGMTEAQLFEKIKEARQTYTDHPPALFVDKEREIDEPSQVIEAAKKYGATALISWLLNVLRDNQAKRSKSIRFLFEDYGHLLKAAKPAEPKPDPERCPHGHILRDVCPECFEESNGGEYLEKPFDALTFRVERDWKQQAPPPLELVTTPPPITPGDDVDEDGFVAV